MNWSALNALDWTICGISAAGILLGVWIVIHETWRGWFSNEVAPEAGGPGHCSDPTQLPRAIALPGKTGRRTLPEWKCIRHDNKVWRDKGAQ